MIVPRELRSRLPNPMRKMDESEWRSIGVQQSRGWVHYEIHKPEPHILLFRRPLGTDPKTGAVPADILKKIEEREKADAAEKKRQ